MNNEWLGYSSDICVSFDVNEWNDCQFKDKYLFSLESSGDKASYLMCLIAYSKHMIDTDYEVVYDMILNMLKDKEIYDYLNKTASSRIFSTVMMEMFDTISFNTKYSILEDASQLSKITSLDIEEFINDGKILAFYMH